MDNIAGYINTLYEIYFYMIIAYVLLSWIPNARDSFIGELLGKFVEPYLTPFRKLIPPIAGILDVSPIVALIALQFVAMGLTAVLEFLFGLFSR